MSYGFAARLLAYGLILSLLAAAATIASSAAQPPPKRHLHIALSGQKFLDASEEKKKQAVDSMHDTVEHDIGFSNDIVIEKDSARLAEQLSAGKFDLAVYTGYELAQLKQDRPDLRPLAIAACGDYHLRAHVLVRVDNPAGKFADLAGKSFALPLETWSHCRAFLQYTCAASGKTPESFFAKTTRPANLEDAADDVVDGVVDATILDGYGLECYKRRKPGRFVKLKELTKSEIFPAPAIVYMEKSLDPLTIKRFRDGVLRISKTADGRRLLDLWRLTEFLDVPEDYNQTLENIVKVYPPRGK
jgi:ABC-type phosphate/phosphonate transport system substrate-binding protein